MAGETSSKVAAVMATSAAALSLAALLKQPVAASGQQLNIPPELIELLVAWAQVTDQINSEVAQILANLPGGGAIQGYPPNCPSVTTSTKRALVANNAMQLSDMPIPDGFALVIKAHPLNAVGSLIFVGRGQAEAINPDLAWPLVPNESVSYFVKNANALYVSSNIVGSTVVFTAEQRS
jgi:hypothetical protein